MIIQNTTPFRKLIWFKRLMGETTTPVEKTVSGSVIHVTDALAKFAKNLTVSIKPVQSGTGDPAPDNIRPITGWTGCNAYRSGADTSEPTIYSITFPAAAGTVYGGTLDVTTGVLTVTHTEMKLSESSGVSANSATGDSKYVWNVATGNMKARGVTNVICDSYATEDAINTTLNNYCVCGRSNSTLLTLRDDRYATKEELLAAMGDAKFVFELVTPETYQLTPTQVKLLLGENYVWADTGDSELTYLAEA